jgi:hypothetical protein
LTIEIQPLSLQHLDDVFALFTAKFDKLPIGTLNHKSYETFADLLSSPGGVNLGIFTESKLVGYTLCEVRPWSGAPDPFALGALLSPGEPVGEALGILIDNAFQGSSLGVRLFRARRSALTDKGVRHVTGMMLVDNFSSIITYLRSGGLLCGFDYDDYDLLNFSHYSGDLADRPPEVTKVETSELDEMYELFGRGYVCRSLTWDKVDDRPKPVYSMSAEFVGRA